MKGKKIYKITRYPSQYIALINCYKWMPPAWEYVTVEDVKFEGDTLTVRFRRINV